MKITDYFVLTPEQEEKFAKFESLLLEWNEKFNLTAILDHDEITEKHFIDSLLATNFVELKHGRLLDIGSGAGFPGIPLAIYLPKLKITLLESNGKKVTFLNEVVKQLNLENVTVINGRAEDLKNREYYDFVTARAVKALNILMELTIPFVKVHGALIAYKGRDADAEIIEAKSAFKKLNCKLKNSFAYELPKTKDNRKLLVIIKEKATLKKYPRNYSEISKQPL